MSIDTLRKADNTYRSCEFIDAARAVNCGHTQHLQTERGIVAIRPYTINKVRINPRTGQPYFRNEYVGENWLVEFYPTGHNHGDDIQLRTNDKDACIAFIIEHLNGTVNGYEANDSVTVFANQADREGWVLATIGNETLIEYLMPNGSSALRVQKVIGRRYVGNYKAVSYNNVPKRWVRAMAEQGTNDWEGRGQRSTVRIPFPA